MGIILGVSVFIESAKLLFASSLSLKFSQGLTYIKLGSRLTELIVVVLIKSEKMKGKSKGFFFHVCMTTVPPLLC